MKPSFPQTMLPQMGESYPILAIRLVEEVYKRHPLDDEGQSLETVLHFAEQLPNEDERVAFLLKHVIYVDEINQFTLMAYHFPPHVIKAACFMKRFPEDTYVEYVESVLTNAIAFRVMMRYWAYFSRLDYYPFPAPPAKIRQAEVYKRALALAQSQTHYPVLSVHR